MTDPTPDSAAQAKIEEQLRNRLADQAAGVQASDDLVDGVYRRHQTIRRRRTAGGVAMSVASLLLVAVIGLTLLSQTDAASNTEAASAMDATTADQQQDQAPAQAPLNSNQCGQPTSPSGPTDITIWLETGVAETAVTELTAELTEAASVLTFWYVDQAETYLEFQNHYRDEPEILSLVTADELPTSFRVLAENREAAAKLATQFTESDGVAEVESVLTCWLVPCDSPRAASAATAAAVIWLELGVGQAEIDELRTELEATASILQVEFIDQAGAYALLGEHWADQPEILNLIDPETLQVSFKIGFSDSEQANAVAEDLKKRVGVERVEFIRRKWSITVRYDETVPAGSRERVEFLLESGISDIWSEIEWHGDELEPEYGQDDQPIYTVVNTPTTDAELADLIQEIGSVPGVAEASLEYCS